MSSLVKNYLGQGTAAARPATPTIDPLAIGFYYATDTGVQSVYANGAWRSAGGADPGTPPVVVQSKIAFVSAAKTITFDTAPTNGNLMVAMFFNPSDGTVGAGWTSQGSNSSGTDYGVVASKVAGAAEPAAQVPIASNVTGIICIWEISGAAASSIFFSAQSQVEGAALIGIGPSFTNLKNCLALGAVSLVSTSNSISALYNMTQDQIIATGTTRQGVMGHSDLRTASTAQPIATFTGTGTPGFKCALAVIRA